MVDQLAGVVMRSMENKLQVYNALQRAAERIQAWHWATHPNCRAKYNKRGKLTKQFFPDEFAVELCKISGKVLSGELDPEMAMAHLHTGEYKYRLDQAREAGF